MRIKFNNDTRRKAAVVFFAPVIISTALLGCAKKPEKFTSPTAKIDLEIKENKEQYNLKFSAGLHNENSDKAFISMKGRAVISEKDGRVLMQLPFELPVILPFEKGVVEVDKPITEKEAASLAVVLGSDREDMIKSKGIENAYIDEKNIKLEIDSYEVSSIIDLLKEKIK